MFWKVRATPSWFTLRRVHARGVVTVHHDGAARGLVDLGEQVEDRCLARAVGADESG